ncbi:hypothetical protein [Nocardia abscessus]|uniref:hypothetical protein n=1 Tax=Nocardia abscessus TaxID=120957 RepID=UPI002453E783|nr:hypothetical protein [Nocardia abscessus]
MRPPCLDELSDPDLRSPPVRHGGATVEVLRAALAERGIVTLLLGAAVPDSALTDALSYYRRPCLLMLWSQMPETATPKTLCAVRPAAQRVLVAGPGWATVTLPSEVLYVRSLEDALETLSELGRRHGAP